MIFVGLITSSMRHVSLPRLRVICLSMLQCTSRFATNECLLDHIIPYVYECLTDKSAAVRAAALECIGYAVLHLQMVPHLDVQLFEEYLFPAILLMVNDSNAQVRYTVAHTIASLFMAAHKLLELEFAERATVLPMETVGACPPSLYGKQQEDYDSRLHQLREKVKEILSPLLISSFQEVKLGLVSHIRSLSELLGATESSTYLLPYLVMQMNGNDPAFRCAYCEALATVGSSVGVGPTQQFILPCLEQALMDMDEQVVTAALNGLTTIIEARLLKNREIFQRLVSSHLGAVLLLPSTAARKAVFSVFKNIEAIIGRDGFFTFIIPRLQPYCNGPIVTLRDVQSAVKPPVSRIAFLYALNTASFEAANEEDVEEDEEKGDCLKWIEGLHITQEERDDEDTLQRRRHRAKIAGYMRSCISDSDWEALELLQPYIRMSKSGNPGAHSSSNFRTLDESLPHKIVDVRSTQSLSVKPLNDIPVNQSIHVATQLVASVDELDGGVGGVPGGLLNTPMTLKASMIQTAVTLWAPYDVIEIEKRAKKVLPGAVLYEGEDSDKWLGLIKVADTALMDTLNTRDWRALVQGIPPDPLTFSKDKQLDGSRLSLANVTHGLNSAGSYNNSPSQVGVSPPSNAMLPHLQAAISYSSTRVELSDSVSASAKSGSPASAPLDPLRSLAPTGSNTLSSTQAWSPKGVLVSTLYEHERGGGKRCISVKTADNGKLLITASHEADGHIKLWNCQDLEKNWTGMSFCTWQISSHASITCLSLLSSRNVVAVGTSQGSVHLHPIDIIHDGICEASATFQCPVRLPHPYSIRSPSVAHRRHPGYQPLYGDVLNLLSDSREVVCMEAFETEVECLMLMCLQNGQIYGWDLRSSEVALFTDIPLMWGAPTCMCVGPLKRWFCVGTKGGVLLLYDLRLLMAVRVWALPVVAPILKVVASERASPFETLHDRHKSCSVYASIGGETGEILWVDLASGNYMANFLIASHSDKGSTAGGKSVDGYFACKEVRAAQPPRLIEINHLVEAPATAACGGSHITVDAMDEAAKATARSLRCTRALWAAPCDSGYQDVLLAASADCCVRYWPLESNRFAEAYVVIGTETVKPRSTFYTTKFGDGGIPVVVQEERHTNGGMKAACEEPLRGPRSPTANHKDAILDISVIQSHRKLLVTAGRDGLVKIWK